MRSVRRVLSVLLAAALMTPVMSAAGLQSIRSASFADANTGYMGGAYTDGNNYDGFVSVTRDGGQTWSAKRLDGNNNIVSVASNLDGQKAFAAPDFSDNKPFITANWGGAWAPTPVRVPGSDVQLTAVERVANDHMLVVGKRYGTYGGEIGFIAESENGGNSWSVRQKSEEYSPTETTDPLPSNADMRDVDTRTGAVIWAVGNERNPGTGGDSATFKKVLIYRSNNGGTTWAQQSTTANATGLSMSSVAVANDTTAYIAGNYWLVQKTTNNGATWASVTNPAGAMGAGTPNNTKGFNDIAAVDANTVVAVGDEGRIARTTNGGTSWVGYQTPQRKKLRSVAILSATKWIAVGDDETVYETTNAGTSWDPKSAGIGNPEVTVTSPMVQLLTNEQKVVAGSVEDAGVGVAEVEASIRRKDGKYAQEVNSSSWGATEKWFPITVQANQSWSFNWTPDVGTVAGGEAWVKVRATDGLGNSSFKTVAYQPDTQEPEITVGGVVDGATYGGAVTPVFSATDNVGVKAPGPTATLNGAPFTSGTPVSANNGYTLVVTASDEAGNVAVETVAFTIDSSYPQITVTGVEHNKHYKTTVTPDFDAEHGSGIQTLSATLNSAPYTTPTPVSAEGGYTFEVTAVPVSGPTATAQIDFVIDKTKPEITLSGVDDPIYKTPVTPVFSATDANLLGPVQATLNGAPFASGTTIGADDDYTLEVTATDKAGNEEKVTADFRVDTTVPSVVDTKTVYKHNRTEVSLRATDEGAGVRKIGYKVNGGSEKFLYAASATALVDGFGTRKLEYRAYDNAGNSSDWSELTVRVKRNVALTITAPTTSAYASAKITGTLKDSVSKGGLVGRWVRIEQYSGGWKLVGGVRTGAMGAFSYTVKPTIKTKYRAVYLEDSTSYLRGQSAERTIQPKASLGKPWKSVKTVRAKKTYTWYASIKPRHSAGTKPVKLQFERYKSGKWRAYKTVSATAYNYTSSGVSYSRVKVKYKLPYKGTWRVRAVHSDTGHATSYSSWYKFKVK